VCESREGREQYCRKKAAAGRCRPVVCDDGSKARSRRARSRRGSAQTHRPVSRKRSLVFADRHLAGLFLFGQLDIAFTRVGVGGIDFWCAFAANSGEGQGEKGSEQKERPSLLHGNAFRGNMTANTAAMHRNKNVIEAEQPEAKTWPV